MAKQNKLEKAELKNLGIEEECGLGYFWPILRARAEKGKTSGYCRIYKDEIQILKNKGFTVIIQQTYSDGTVQVKVLWLEDSTKEARKFFLIAANSRRETARRKKDGANYKRPTASERNNWKRLNY